MVRDWRIMSPVNAQPNPTCKHGTDTYVQDCVWCEWEMHNMDKDRAAFMQQREQIKAAQAYKRANNFKWWSVGVMCGVLLMLALVIGARML